MPKGTSDNRVGKKRKNQEKRKERKVATPVTHLYKKNFKSYKIT